MSLRRFMLAPLLVGLTILMMRVPLPEEFALLNDPWLNQVAARYFVALIGHPWLYLCILAIRAFWRRRWRALFISVII